MYEWNETVQKMVDWIEDHIEEEPSLLEMSRQIGYSPSYCSSQFHTIVGMTLRRYIAGRKLCHATLEIRDTGARILDIAVKYGYSSQEALTRAFVAAYGCTPYAYRKSPRPVKLSVKQNLLFPAYYEGKGAPTMNKTILTDANVRTEYIPAHTYMGIWEEAADNYMAFWSHHSCDQVCGTIESLSHIAHPVVTCHTAGWSWKNGKRCYFYGLGVEENYTGEIPDGFTVRHIPAGYYLVFFHPPFDFLKDCGEVMNRVESLAWSFDPASMGYAWDEENRQDYQRHYPEVLGYEVLRPVKKLRHSVL